MHIKKILHTTHTWLPRTENWIYEQIQNLPKQFESSIIALKTKNLKDFPHPNVKSLSKNYVHHLFRRAQKLFRMTSDVESVLNLIKSNPPVLLHSHFGDQAWRDLPVARALRLKHLASFYGYDLGYLPRKDSRWLKRYLELFESVHRVLCEGPHVRSRLIEMGCPAHKVKVHRLGIKLDEIRFKARTWDGHSPLRFLMASSFQEKKGLPYALKALADLKTKFPFEVTLVGDAPAFDKRAAKEKQKILSVIQEEGMQSLINLPGYLRLSELRVLAHEHHIFIAPSVTAEDGDTEGGAPVTLLEMMASGIPVVSSFHCDIPNIVEDRISGLLCQERASSEIADKILWLAENRDFWKSLTSNARNFVEKEHDAKIQGRRLGEIYDEILESSD